MMYVVVTVYDNPKKAKIITHVYGSTAQPGWTKERAELEKRKMLREVRVDSPDTAHFLRVSVCRITDVELMNQTWKPRPKPVRQELQGPHQGPSGETLI